MKVLKALALWVALLQHTKMGDPGGLNCSHQSCNFWQVSSRIPLACLTSGCIILHTALLRAMHVVMGDQGTVTPPEGQKLPYQNNRPRSEVQMLTHHSNTSTSGHPVLQGATEAVIGRGKNYIRRFVCPVAKKRMTGPLGATAGAIHLQLEVTNDPSKLMRSLTGVSPALRMPYMARKLLISRPIGLPSVWTGVTVKPRSTPKKAKEVTCFTCCPGPNSSLGFPRSGEHMNWHLAAGCRPMSLR